MFPDFEGTSGASSYDGKHAPGAAPSDWSYRIRRTISEHLREHSLGVLQKIEKGLWHSTRHTVKDQLRAATGRGPKRHPGPGGRRSVGVSYGLSYPMSALLEAVSNRLSRVGPYYGGDMNPSQDSRFRLTLATLAIAVLALGASAKSGAEKQKSLAERMYDNRVNRCKAMMGKDEMSRCDVRSGTTYDEKLRGLHRTMMDRITKAQPEDGTCSKYGATYLVCDEKMLGGKMMYTIYRLDRAKDGSDNYSMYVWSREY